MNSDEDGPSATWLDVLAEMWHGSRTQGCGRSRHMFLSRDAHNGTIITSERGASRRRLGGKEDSKNAHRHDLRKRKTEGAHCVTAATERCGRSHQRESVACTDFVYISEEECYIQRAAVSCQRTRSVRLLGAAQRKALLRGCESHTGLIAPPPPQLLTGIGTSDNTCAVHCTC